MDATRRLLRAAGVGFTSCVIHRKRLLGLNRTETPLAQARIFSNVDELERTLPITERERQLVIFGQLSTRVRLYREFAERLDGIVDAGSGSDAAIPLKLGEFRVVRTGFLSEAEASALLGRSVAGVVRYGPIAWEKSGVLAAYQAHGMVPVIAEPGREGFRAFSGMPFALFGDLLAKEDGIRDAEMQELAACGHRFYIEVVALARTRSESAPHCMQTMRACEAADGKQDARQFTWVGSRTAAGPSGGLRGAVGR